jgi:hypothetical protein
VARRRERWQARQKQVAPGRLVFIDETWAKTNMAPLRGWAPKGQRLTTKVPQGRRKTLTFLAALRCDSIEAPWLIDGPINGERFRLYVEKVLVPVLRPGDIVVMDNLGSHRGLEVRRAIRNAGARLFSCPNTPRTSIRSNRFLPSSSTCCAALSRAASTPSATRSAKPSTRSPRRNAPITSSTQATHKPKPIPL